MKKMFKEHKAITLIALIITIIILIILAGVTINLTLGNNGLLNKAKEAKEMQSTEEIKEKLSIAKSEYDIKVASEGYNKSFLEFLEEEKNYDVDYDDEEHTQGTIILNGNVFNVNSESSQMNIEYVGTSDAIYVKKIKISPTANNKTIVSKNGTTTLQAIIEPSNATDKSITWSTSDPLNSTITNNNDGTVTITVGDTEETVTITATANDKKGEKGSIQIEIWEGTLITNRSQLEAMTATGNYRLGDDIDLSGSDWSSLNINFSGTLDGQGHTIKGLTGGALFSKVIAGATIQNLKFTDVNISGSGVYTRCNSKRRILCSSIYYCFELCYRKWNIDLRTIWRIFLWQNS